MPSKYFIIILTEEVGGMLSFIDYAFIWKYRVVIWVLLFWCCMLNIRFVLYANHGCQSSHDFFKSNSFAVLASSSPCYGLCSFRNFQVIRALLRTKPLVNEFLPGNLVQKIDRMYAAFTGQPIEKVQQYTERDRFLSAAEVMFINPSFP